MSIISHVKRTDPSFSITPYETAATFLIVSTNLIVTGMISIYLISARRSLAKVLPSRDLQLYTGVVAVLVESALPLAVFGIIFAVILIYTPKETTQGVETQFALSNVVSLFFYSFIVSRTSQ